MTDFDKAIEDAGHLKDALAEVLPFESWERLQGESSSAFAAFCAYRDFGAERNIRKTVESSLAKTGGEKDSTLCEKRYRTWRNWCSQFRWRERAADFDSYVEKMKAAELRKTIEAQGEKHREVTGKMLDVVIKKLDTMNAEDLSQGTVTEWVQTAIKADREIAGLTIAETKAEPKQGEFNFVSDFQGL